MTAPFVGRAQELDVLRGLIARARREGAPTGGLISGEPGSGKSRLLLEAIAGVDPNRCVRLVGFEPTQPVPLAAAADLLRRLATVPEHGPRLEALAFGQPDPRGQGALPAFEAAHRAVGAFGPLVVAVDDVQWLDGQSLGLLHYLLRAAESTRQPLTVIAAARPSPAEMSLTAAMSGAIPEPRRTAVVLGGLSREAGVELARAVDERLDEQGAEEVWKRAAGSPFWVEALARREGQKDGAQLVTDRLRALTPDGAELINALAVGGRPFRREQLATIAGWVADRLEHAVRELAGRGLALDEYGSVRLSHDLIREGASATIPSAARLALHARLAELLEGWAGSDLHLLLEALEHRQAAGLPASDLASRILASPQRRLIGIDGLAHLGSIADDQPTPSLVQVGLDTDIGQLASVLGDHGLALRHWLRVADHAFTPADRREAATEAALAAFRLGRSRDALALLDRARDFGPQTHEALARQEALKAEIALWLDHDTRGGAAAANRALAAARAMLAPSTGFAGRGTGARQAYLGALEASIGAAMQEERFDDVRRLTAEILPAARTLGEEAYVLALLRSGFALRPLGAIEEAERMYREAWDIAHREVLPFPMIEAGIGLARALRDLGRLDESRSIGLETLDLEGRLGAPPGRWGNAGATLHAAELSIGESAAALERVRADATAHPNPHFRMWIHQLLAVWQARGGGARMEGEVQAAIAAGRADAALAGCPRCGGELSVASVEALARIGRVDDARRELAVWELRGVADYPWQEMLRIRAQASIAMADGDRAPAVALLGRLRAALEAASLLDELVWAFLDLGDVQSTTDRGAAVDAYTTAASLADGIGAASRARLANKALRRLGVRTWRRGPAPGRGHVLRLSDRERQVAALVAGGATNLEVATSLAISSKTVERHVTNILAKAGARNRTELAARLRDAGTGFPR
jgi:DNA-binding CsgD family transcriptional regulator/tetratricopeptide (TPR) repeat protein